MGQPAKKLGLFHDFMEQNDGIDYNAIVQWPFMELIIIYGLIIFLYRV